MNHARKKQVYVFGTPGEVGGAATRLYDLLPLIAGKCDVCVLLRAVEFLKDGALRRYLDKHGIRYGLRKDLPRKASGIALAVCERDLFASGAAYRIKEAGLKLVWSNEMTWAFDREAEAAAEGVVDRVLFVSEFQRQAFLPMYAGVDWRIVPNYIDPNRFPFVERDNPTFTIGRLSRPAADKYPVDFPVFYEELLPLSDVRFRVQAWSDELRRLYAWHDFGPQWELLPPNKLTAPKFLSSLDAFVYPIGHRCFESWGRATVEAMLTGCVPVVPSGHTFHVLLNHGTSGFICKNFHEFQTCVRELYKYGSLRRSVAKNAAEHSREHLCNRATHEKLWEEALTFE